MSGAHSGPTPDDIRDELSRDPESRSKRPRVVPKRFQDCSTNHADSDVEDQDPKPKLKSSPSQKSQRIITKTESGKVKYREFFISTLIKIANNHRSLKYNC